MDKLAKQDQFTMHGYRFTESQYKVIKADQSPSIRQSKEHEAKAHISVAIMKASQRLGHNQKSDQEITIMTDDVYKFIKAKYPTTKVDEICLAIEFGSFGEYNDDVIYLSATNIHRWIKSFLNQKHVTFKLLQKAKEKNYQRQQEEFSQRKQEEFWLNFPEMVQDEFESYNAKGEFTPNGWLVVRCLDKIGFNQHLDISKERKLLMLEEMLIKAKKVQHDDLQRKFWMVHDKLISDNKVHDRAVAMCKEKCLMLWFDDQSELDLEMFKKDD